MLGLKQALHTTSCSIHQGCLLLLLRTFLSITISCSIHQSCLLLFLRTFLSITTSCSIHPGCLLSLLRMFLSITLPPMTLFSKSVAICNARWMPAGPHKEIHTQDLHSTNNSDLDPLSAQLSQSLTFSAPGSLAAHSQQQQQQQQQQALGKDRGPCQKAHAQQQQQQQQQQQALGKDQGPCHKAHAQQQHSCVRDQSEGGMRGCIEQTTVCHFLSPAQLLAGLTCLHSLHLSQVCGYVGVWGWGWVWVWVCECGCGLSVGVGVVWMWMWVWV